jgi:para-nitrobenzyl esterase
VLQASPLAMGLFDRIIGESGAYMVAVGSGPVPTFRLDSSDVAQRVGAEYVSSIGAKSLSDLRAKSAEEIQRTAKREDFVASIDGWVLPDDVRSIFAKGRHNDVPVLIGWNADEGGYFAPPPSFTAATFREQSARLYGDQANRYLEFYPANTDDEARASAREYFRDFMCALQMRAWARAQRSSPVYGYTFERVAPDAGNGGAHHGAEVPYAFNNVRLSARPFAVEDEALSDLVAAYWVNFATTGNPNAAGLPPWPQYEENGDLVMVLGDRVEARLIAHRDALDFLDALFGPDLKQRPAN